MKKKRHRLGIKDLNGEFIEIFNIKPHKDGFIMWVPGSDKHITTLNDLEEISSHITNQKEDKREHLGRLLKNASLDEDEMIMALLKPRKLDESEYDKLVFYANKEFAKMWGDQKLEMVTEESEKEIISYIDLMQIFENAMSIAERIVEAQQVPFIVETAREAFSREDFEVGITENKMGIIEFEGELWEFDPTYLYQLGAEDHPWAEYLKPLGIFELLKEVDIGEKLRKSD